MSPFAAHPLPHPDVAFADGHLRLDQILQRWLGLSRRQARQRIAAGEVAVEGRPARIIARPIGAGARVELLAAAPMSAPAVPAWPRILALTAHAVAVDKPSGLLAECDRFGAPAVETWLPQWLAHRGERQNVWLVHRLDAATSGVMVLARRPQAARLFGRAFAERQVSKRYVALVAGQLQRQTLVDAAIARVAGTRHGVAADGKPAQTRVTPLAGSASATWVLLEPLSGRTHQLRVHLAHLGHPIIGDRLYGGPLRTPDHRPVARLMLHAAFLSLPDPTTAARRWQVHAEVPVAMAQIRAAFAVESPP